MDKKPPWILPVIIFSQFAGTSLWFAGNAVLGDLQRQWSFSSHSLGYMISAVQLGFILGTLCFAFLTISDRFSPRIVFFVCSLLAACSNLLIRLAPGTLDSVLVFRFLTGFFMAGVYPVGMKIASGWYQKGLGRALGFLVGALALGAALPYLLKGANQSVPWETIILSVSVIAVLGGLSMLLLVPDGPFLLKGTKFNSRALILIFESKGVRSAAFGYFGHMWELYALLAFAPVLLTDYGAANPGASLNVPFWSFCILASGCVGCAGGGMVSGRVGSATVAFIQLAASGICCLLSPLFPYAPLTVFLALLIFWGCTAAGDSPQFSTLVARTAPPALVGSALTIVNCIGFSLTILSIQMLSSLSVSINHHYIFLFLTPGPILGLVWLWPLVRSERRGKRPVL
jgi:MFS family permease